MLGLLVVLLGMTGKYAPHGSLGAELALRLADSLTIGVMLSMTFFANSILYGSIYSEKKALLLSLYVLIEGAVIVTFYWVLPVTFLQWVTYNEITYSLHPIITIAYFPVILPILYVFINMEKVDPDNKKKYRLYLIGFISLLIELAFDMPGTLPELMFVWRCFALTAMIIVIIALLIPRVE